MSRFSLAYKWYEGEPSHDDEYIHIDDFSDQQRENMVISSPSPFIYIENNESRRKFCLHCVFCITSRCNDNMEGPPANWRNGHSIFVKNRMPRTFFAHNQHHGCGCARSRGSSSSNNVKNMTIPSSTYVLTRRDRFSQTEGHYHKLII